MRIFVHELETLTSSGLLALVVSMLSWSLPLSPLWPESLAACLGDGIPPMALCPFQVLS